MEVHANQHGGLSSEELGGVERGTLLHSRWYDRRTMADAHVRVTCSARFLVSLVHFRELEKCL